MIEYLSIDLETKSGTDLSRSGVYRYTEDPAFVSRYNAKRREIGKIKRQRDWVQKIKW